MQEETDTFWGHVSGLRTALLRVFAVIFIGFGCSLFFYQDILSFVTAPLHQHSALTHQEIKQVRITNASGKAQTYQLLPGESIASSFKTNKIDDDTLVILPEGYISLDRLVPAESLVILSPIEGMITSFKVSLWIGFVATSPLWIYFLLQFILPALNFRERKALCPFLAFSLLFISMGFFFAYYVTIPLANAYFILFNEGIGLNLWSLSNYLDYTLFLLLSNGLAFELGLVLFFLVHLGLLSAETMIEKRRHMIVAAFILGALLTPPDVLTQLMLAIPLIALYEATILYARFRKVIKLREHG